MGSRGTYFGAILVLAHAIAAAAPAADPWFVAGEGGDEVGGWKPLDGSGAVALSDEETPDGRPALRFPCDMARVAQRAYWDRDGKADLAGASAIALWVRASGDPAAVASGTLYLRARGGWYGAPLDIGFDGWSRVTLRRSDFVPEGSPAGWGTVEGVRVAFWKGADRPASVLLGGLDSHAPRVAVLRGSRAGGEAGRYAKVMEDILGRAGIDAAAIDDADVEAGALAEKRVAVLPHLPSPSAADLDAVEAFVRGGGKIFACYDLHERIGKLLGIESAGFLARERPGHFASIRARGDAVAGMPAEVRQDSWNIIRVRAVGEGARVAARWFDAEGNDTGHAAIVVSPAGAYVSHVILPDDPEGKARLLRAVLGHLDPAVWKETVGGLLGRAGRISSWESLEAAEEGIAKLAASSGRDAPAREALARAREARREGVSAAEAGRHADAVAPLERSRRDLLQAFARAQAPRDGEFRGVWCHSAFGPSGMSWDEAVRILKEGGFNAVVPNMLWGGVADYPSQVLPVRERVTKEGDPVAGCLAACRRHGVAMHVWKVNWNLSGAPADFVDRMRKAGRLQRSSDGAEAAWLCPSHPDNLALERESMLEVARNYDVDGLHFDYIRYPDSTKCYCDGCRERFEAESGRRVTAWPKDVLRGGEGHPQYQEFRRSSITRLVMLVSEEARALRPHLRISAAVFPNWPQCREEIGQDWGAWVEKGWLDFVCPMDYTSSNASFRARVRSQLEAVGGRVPLYPGVGASAPGLPLDQVIDQVGIARAEGADGFIVFNFDGEVAREYVPAFGLGLTGAPATPPHEAPEVEWRALQDGAPIRDAAKATAPLVLVARPTTRGRFRSPVREAEAAFAVCARDGSAVAELGRARSEGPEARGEVRLSGGAYRLVARGRVTLEDGTVRDFVWRGPVIHIQD